MRKCAICGKTSVIGGSRKKLRGKYNPTNQKRKYPNLQWVRLSADSKRIKACTQCIKALSRRKS